MSGAPTASAGERTRQAAHGAAAAPRPAAGIRGIAGWAERVLEEVLTPTFWLDPGEAGDPFRATIWFSGRRAGVTGKRPGDAFTREVAAGPIVPGSGPVAVITEVRGLNPGDWVVTARPVARSGSRVVRPYSPGRDGGPPGWRRAVWPRWVGVSAGPRATVSTAMLPFTKSPGIIRPAYAGLVGLGVVAGLAVQAALSPGWCAPEPCRGAASPPVVAWPRERAALRGSRRREPGARRQGREGPGAISPPAWRGQRRCGAGEPKVPRLPTLVPTPGGYTLAWWRKRGERSSP